MPNWTEWMNVNSELFIPVLYSGVGSYVGNPQNVNTGDTVIKNEWKKLDVENCGQSTVDGIGYPTSLSNTALSVYGFTSLEETGTLLKSITSGTPINALDISEYEYIKFHIIKTGGGAGSQVSAINVRFYN